MKTLKETWDRLHVTGPDELAVTDYTIISPRDVRRVVLAKAILELMPPLSPTEQDEVDHIYRSRITRVPRGRPFRAPHFSVTPKAMKEEIILATHGILFLDNVDEMCYRCQEVVRVSRTDEDRAYVLIIGRNECACGPVSDRPCVCSPRADEEFHKQLPKWTSGLTTLSFKSGCVIGSV